MKTRPAGGILHQHQMTVPMAAWMRFRGMEWAPIVEMSAAMFAEAPLLISVAGLGFLSNVTPVDWLHRLMMPVMLIPMLFRLDLYMVGLLRCCSWSPVRGRERLG